jgi:hypothetical protein
MNDLLSLVWFIFALGLIGTVIWAFWTYVTIPGPFAWLKGLLMFVLVVFACFFLWDQFLGAHLAGAHFGRARR